MHGIFLFVQKPFLRLQNGLSRGALSLRDKDRIAKAVLSLPEDPDALDGFYRNLEGAFLRRYHVIRPDRNNIEFLNRDAGKAQAMLRLKKDIFHADRTVSFGDGGNDLDMIREADVGVAMGNAADACKEAAELVTADNDHDGIADAVEKLM